MVCDDRGAMSRRPPAVVAVVVAALVVLLTSCRVDVAVDVTVEADGSGTISVVATADAQLLAEVPDLADDLALDDLRGKGWTVEGPDATDSGGLRVALSQDYDDLEGLNAALVDLGGPFRQVRVAREDTFARTTWRLSGTLRLDDGLASFADTDLLTALGTTPYQDDLDARGLALRDAVSVQLRVHLPGTLAETTGIEQRSDGTTFVTWTAPLDGSSMSVATTSERVDRGAKRADTVASVAQFLFVAWCITALTFIVWVIFARTRRHRRRRRMDHDWSDAPLA